MYLDSIRPFRQLLPFWVVAIAVNFATAIMSQNTAQAEWEPIAYGALNLFAWSVLFYEALALDLQPLRPGVFDYVKLQVGFCLRVFWLSIVSAIIVIVPVIFALALGRIELGWFAENPSPIKVLPIIALYSLSFSAVYTRWGSGLSNFVARLGKRELQTAYSARAGKTKISWKPNFRPPFWPTFVLFVKGPAMIFCLSVIPGFLLIDGEPAVFFDQNRDPKLLTILVYLIGCLSFAYSTFLTAWILSQSYRKHASNQDEVSELAEVFE